MAVHEGYVGIGGVQAGRLELKHHHRAGPQRCRCSRGRERGLDRAQHPPGRTQAAADGHRGIDRGAAGASAELAHAPEGVHDAVHADGRGVHGVGVVSRTLHQELASAPQPTRDQPQKVAQRHEAIAEIVDHLGGLPACPIGDVGRVEALPDDRLQGDARLVAREPAADDSRQADRSEHRSKAAAPAPGSSAAAQALLALSPSGVVARRQRRQERGRQR